MKIGRNDLCPCGSGKKYKYCCLNNKEEAIKQKQIASDMYGALFGLHKMMLESKPHIRKYRKIRKIHSDVLDSMIDYYDSNKYTSDKMQMYYDGEYDCQQLVHCSHIDASHTT